jgi:glycosyltransferase involved in cell wall biosynthesis
MISDSQVAESTELEAYGKGLRVVAIIDTAFVSGPGRQLTAVINRLAALGVEARVVTFHRRGRPRSPYVDYLERAGVQCTVFEERGRFDVRLVARLRQSLDQWAPEVVQTHGYKPTVLAYLLHRLGARWHWVGFYHGATSENAAIRFYSFLDRILLGSADRVVVMSRAHIDQFARLGKKVGIIYNAAITLPDPASPAPRVVRAAVSSRPCIGVVGRLSPEKGIDVFLRACRDLADRGCEFRAEIVGDGPERASLEELRAALNLEDLVKFTGVVENMPGVYAALDLLVIPSRSEGLPNVLLEALSANLPVVATRVGAIPEVLEDSGAGRLVTPDSPRALADAIEQTLMTPVDPATYEARRAVVERFSLERRAMAHLRLYAELCGSRAGQVSADTA